jgi:hypothetical protein
MLVAGNCGVEEFYSQLVRKVIYWTSTNETSINNSRVFFIIENMLFDTSQPRTDIDKICIIAVESMFSVALIIWYPCAKV